MAALVYLPPVAAVAGRLPFRARWHIGLVVVALVLAVLAGVGTDVLVRTPRHWLVRTWLVSGFSVAGVVIVMLWLLGRGHLAPAAARLRDESFAWPVAGVALGLVVVAALSRPGAAGGRAGAGPLAGGRAGAGPLAGGRGRAGPVAAVALLAGQTAFLVAVGASVWASSGTFLPSTPAVRALQAEVGSSTVGFGAGSCELPPTLGILPESNGAFGVHELSAYDPITPRAYFRALRMKPATPVSAFCPVVTTVAQARRYGVRYVLEPAGRRGPRGAVYVGAVGDEGLYRVPGAASATVSPLPVTGRLPANGAPGTPVAVAHPDPATWKMVVTTGWPQVLRLRLTDIPGWHATIDGRPLRLQRYAQVMLQARIPPGRHVVELAYWPGTFTAGLGLAACSALALLGAVVVARRHRRGTP
jgi:hypothetical protein